MSDGIGDDEPKWRKVRKRELVAEKMDLVQFLRVAALMQPAEGDFGIYLELAAEEIEMLQFRNNNLMDTHSRPMCDQEGKS